MIRKNVYENMIFVIHEWILFTMAIDSFRSSIQDIRGYIDHTKQMR